MCWHSTRELLLIHLDEIDVNPDLPDFVAFDSRHYGKPKNEV